VISSGRFSLTATNIDCSSLNGHRRIADVFHILDYDVKVNGCPDDFFLTGVHDASHIVRRSDTGGNIMAGDYLIRTLHLIYLHVSVFIVPQSLWIPMRKFHDESYIHLRFQN
jgi:hypothetical protein